MNEGQRQPAIPARPFSFFSLASKKKFSPCRSANIKIGIIRGGQRDVVLNKEGKRKVSALVGINRHGDRVFSAAAESLLKQYPELVQRYSKHLLGKKPDHPWIKRNGNFYTTPIVADARGTAAVQMGNATVPALEIVAWLFKQAREAARHHVRVGVVDAVIAVPPYFTQWERMALLHAAKLAGLEVLSLVNEGTAVAIDYFVSRTIGEEPKLVLLYDMGDVATKVTLVRFDREKSETPGGKDTPQASILDVAWDDSLGGRNFDENLAQHLLQLATKGSKLNVAANARAVEKLRAESQRVKEVLSANTEIEARCEGLLDEYNFAHKVTRTEFERLNAVLFSELLEPIKVILQSNKLTTANISEIQMLGGGTRVPKVREAIAAYFGRPNVDTHLNGDDAICMGSAFYAAMKSNAFKKQNFKFRDLTLFPVSMSHPTIGNEPAGEAKILFGYQNKLFSKKVVSFVTDEPVWMRLRYEIDAGPRRLPAGTPRELIKVEVPAVNASGYNVTEGSTPRVSVSYRLSSSGTVQVESADAQIEVWELPPPPPPPKKVKKAPVVADANSTNSTNSTGAANSTNATATEEPIPEPVILPPIRVNRTLALAWKETWLGVREYSADEIAKINEHTRQLEEAEQEKTHKAEAVNDLESFVYATRERLSDDDVVRHATGKERESISTALSGAAEFLEGSAIETAGPKLIRNKLAEIREQWRAIERRMKLFKELPDAFVKCRAILKMTIQSLDNVTELRMVNETEVEEVMTKLNGTSTYLNEMEAKVKAAPENLDPPVLPTDIQLRCDIAKGAARKLLFAPKRPKPSTTTKSSTTEEEKTDPPKEDL